MNVPGIAFRHSQRDLVFQQIDPGPLQHEIQSLRVDVGAGRAVKLVHLLWRGGNEHVHIRTLLNLGLKRTGGIEVEGQLYIRCNVLILFRDFRQRFRHAGGSEHDQLHRFFRFPGGLFLGGTRCGILLIRCGARGFLPILGGGFALCFTASRRCGFVGCAGGRAPIRGSSATACQGQQQRQQQREGQESFCLLHLIVLLPFFRKCIFCFPPRSSEEQNVCKGWIYTRFAAENRVLWSFPPQSRSSSRLRACLTSPRARLSGGLFRHSLSLSLEIHKGFLRLRSSIGEKSARKSAHVEILNRL